MENRPAQWYDLSRATDRALRHVEVSAETGCTPEQFAQALRNGRADEGSRLAVALFLDEGEPDAIVAIVAQRASTFATLARLARDLLPHDHPTTAFLEDSPL